MICTMRIWHKSPQSRSSSVSRTRGQQQHQLQRLPPSSANTPAGPGPIRRPSSPPTFTPSSTTQQHNQNNTDFRKSHSFGGRGLPPVRFGIGQPKRDAELILTSIHNSLEFNTTATAAIGGGCASNTDLEEPIQMSERFQSFGSRSYDGLHRQRPERRSSTLSAQQRSTTNSQAGASKLWDACTPDAANKSGGGTSRGSHGQNRRVRSNQHPQQRKSFVQPSTKDDITIPISDIIKVDMYGEGDTIHRTNITTASHGYLEFTLDNRNGQEVLLAFLKANLSKERMVVDSSSAGTGCNAIPHQTKSSCDETVDSSQSFDVEKFTATRMTDRLQCESFGEKVRRKVGRVFLSIEEGKFQNNESGKFWLDGFAQHGYGGGTKTPRKDNDLSSHTRGFLPFLSFQQSFLSQWILVDAVLVVK